MIREAIPTNGSQRKLTLSPAQLYLLVSWSTGCLRDLRSAPCTLVNMHIRAQAVPS